jgi:hypothetical protein
MDTHIRIGETIEQNSRPAGRPSAAAAPAGPVIHDVRPEKAMQQLQHKADDSPHTAQLKQVQGMMAGAAHRNRTDGPLNLTGAPTVAQRMQPLNEQLPLLDKQEGDRPGMTVTWYEEMSGGIMIGRTPLRFSLTGYQKAAYTNYGLPVYQSNKNMLVAVGEQVADTREEMQRRTRLLMEAELLLNEKINQWVKDNISVKKVLGATLGITALGVGVIYGLSLIDISKWVYLGTTALSELIGIWYTVRWMRNELLPGVAKLILVGLNSASMVSAALTVAYHLINSAPINTFIWGALPFGLALGELIAFLLAKKEEWRLELVQRLERDSSV